MNKTTTCDMYKGLPVNCGTHTPLPLRTDILEAIRIRMFHMLNLYKNIKVIRFDLRYPTDYEYDVHDEYIQTFINNFTIYLNRQFLDYQYVWVREKNESENEHYHVVFFIESEIYIRSSTFTSKVQEIWSGIITSTNDNVHLVQINQFLNCHEGCLESKDISAVADYFYWVSYIAKVQDKVLSPGKGKRVWSGSVIRRIEE